MPRMPLHIRFTRWFSSNMNRIGNAWHRLVEPIERLFGYLGESLLGIFDSFEALESVIFRLVSLLFWPFLALGRWLVSWIPSEGPLARLFSFPGRAIRSVALAIFGLAEKLNLDGVLILFAKLLTPIWWPIATLLGFVNAWLATRRPRELALAVPALLLAAPFAYVAIAGTMLSRGKIVESYKIAARDAIEEGNMPLASLLERKLAQLGADTRRSDYRTAIALARNDDLSSAYRRMQRLAPIGFHEANDWSESGNRQGYAAAHVWITQQLLSGKLTVAEEPALKDETRRFFLAEQHLDQLAEMGISGPALAQMLAYIYAETDRLSEAAQVLEPFASESFDAAAMRLRLLAALKQKDEATRQAKTVLLLASQKQIKQSLVSREHQKKSLSTADHEIRVLAAELAGDDQQLELSLRAWQTAEEANSRPIKLLAALLRRRAERLLATGTSNPAQVVELLCDAVRFDSPHKWIALQIGIVADQREGSHHAQLIWERLISSPDVPSDILELVGTIAATHGDILTARKVYQRILKAEKDRVFVWNNYAWVLLQEPEIDVEAALIAVNRALEQRPRDHRFRETRGQVMIKLKRWPEAIEDLEFALNGLPESPVIHRALAEAYEATSQPQLAQIHREQASP